jgi:starch synthase
VSKTNIKFAKSKGIPVLDMPGEDFGDAYEAFFNQISPDDPE